MNTRKYHQGLFNSGEEGICASLRSIKNPKWNFEDTQDNEPGFAYEDATCYYKGACNLFSLALGKEHHYTAYQVIGEDDKLIHSFCVSEQKKQIAFIDVRGITTDFTEFWKFPVFPKEEIHIVLQDIDREYTDLDEDECYGYEFARWIIREHRDMYIIDDMD